MAIDISSFQPTHDTVQIGDNVYTIPVGIKSIPSEAMSFASKISEILSQIDGNAGAVLTEENLATLVSFVSAASKINKDIKPIPADELRYLPFHALMHLIKVIIKVPEVDAVNPPTPDEVEQ